ncbi:MAG: lysine biosynthesis protein LysX [Candidatus Nitrosocaldus sp.]|nr:lysine biosynthesis protein LysX [Candidatus Nitrosocaldus sp.]
MTSNGASLSIVFDRLRWEEKELLEKALRLGYNARLVDAKDLVFSTSGIGKGTRTGSAIDGMNLGDVVIQRCISHYRGLYITACLESLAIPTINGYGVAETCGNKLLCSLALARHNVPTPSTYFIFSAEKAIEMANNLGYPIVFKPIVGSWGRLVIPVKDREMMESIVEMREEMPNPLSKIYYLQEYVRRPPRDIRAIVVGDRVITAVYRYAAEGEWKTNIARGGKAEPCKITKELEDICLRAAEAVGGGVLGIDIMEDEARGLLVHEVNNTVEFRGAASVSSVDIAHEIVSYAMRVVRA